MKWQWIIIVAGLGLFGLSSPAAADYLYQVDQAAVLRGTTKPVGQPIAGLSNIRRLATLAEANRLSIDERRTIQTDQVYHIQYAPDDPQYPHQWNFALMNMSTAWDADTVAPLYGGDPKIIVAVLDTGVAYRDYGTPRQAPDLAQTAFWTNPNETPDDGVDNDNNGFIDDVNGWNFVGDDAYPVDDNGHGTHVAGTIAGSTNNTISTAGIAFNSTIMPLKVLDDKGDGSTATIIAALNYAVSAGAKIVNLSLGGDQEDPLLHRAVASAVSKGVIVIAAAGNAGTNPLTYPSQYPEVISVGSVQYDLTRAAYSNYGPGLTIVAPGGNLELDQNADGYPDGIAQQTCVDNYCDEFNTYFYVGTSQAAAHVSGVAALLESCGLAADKVAGILTSTAKDLGAAGPDEEYGAGLVDAAAAMAAAGCQPIAIANPGTISAKSSKTTSLDLLPATYYPYRQPYFVWTGAGGMTYEVTWKKGTKTISNYQQPTRSFIGHVSSEGKYTLLVRSIDASGAKSDTIKFEYYYRPPALLISRDNIVKLMRPDFKSIRDITVKSSNGLQVNGGVFVTGQANKIMVSAAPQGNKITVMDTLGRTIKTITPFGKSYKGLISTTVIERFDQPALIVAATANTKALIRWFTTDGQQLTEQRVYGNYNGGLSLSSGDVNADGREELIVAQTAGGEIKIYDQQQEKIASLKPLGSKYTGGWSVAVGDPTGNGQSVLYIVPRTSGSTVRAYLMPISGLSKTTLTLKNIPAKQTLNIQVADVNGDGRDDLIVATKTGEIILQSWTATGKLIKKIILSSTGYSTLGLL